MPVALPAPAAAGSPASQEEMLEEEHPTLAEDGLNVDHDGLVVQAAAQLEEELGEGDDAEDLPAGYVRGHQPCANDTCKFRAWICRSCITSAAFKAERAASALSRCGMVIHTSKSS